MSVLPYLLVFFPDTELFCGYESSLTSKLVTDFLPRRPRPRMCVLAHSWATSFSDEKLATGYHPGHPCPF